MQDLTTEAMEFALQRYAEQATFEPDHVTRAILAGCHSDEWMRGIKLAAELTFDQMQATIQMRYAS